MKKTNKTTHSILHKQPESPELLSSGMNGPRSEAEAYPAKSGETGFCQLPEAPGFRPESFTIPFCE
jgi:hypothetical protein